MTDAYEHAQYEGRPSGHILINNKEVAHTLQCCHCGMHFVSVKGSGKVRGFCGFCKKVTCGAAKCDPCIPFQEKIEYAEAVDAVQLGKGTVTRSFGASVKTIMRLEAKYPKIKIIGL